MSDNIETSSIKTEYPVSSGGVVYKFVENELYVIICGGNAPTGGYTWRLPKGTPDEGETLEETAIREVTEETGLHVKIDIYLGNINYQFEIPGDDVRFDKTVHFYLMQRTSGSTKDHDHEFEEVRWVLAGEAIQMLTYDSETNILQKAIQVARE